MKKLVALLLALFLCLSLCACGKSGNEGESSQAGSAAFVKPENYASVLLVTINPQIRLYLDKDSNVLAVEPVNDDAKAVVQKLDIKNKKVDAAVKSIITVSKDEGFVKEGVTVSIKVSEVKDKEISADTITDLVEKSANETFTELKITAEVKTEKVGFTQSDPVNSDPDNSQHHHDFSKATCTEPAKCACGVTRGEPAPHNYVSGVCTMCKKADPDALAAEKEKKNPLKNLKKGKEYYILKPDNAEETMLTAIFITFNTDGSYEYMQAPFGLEDFGEEETIVYKGKTYYICGGLGGGGRYTLTTETITLADSYDMVFTMTTDGKLVVQKTDPTSEFFKVGDTLSLR
ncbi:MAG: hypothetical protein IJX79_00540 [Clostridia bacterium]|nr:hypothetical protein [Clostridia bacterium]